MDADQIFLSRPSGMSSIVPGVGMTASYDLGQGWIKKWGTRFCDGKCDKLENGYDGSYGVPIILTAGDARRHADLWMDLTEEMRKFKPEAWMTEMYSAIIAARRLGIRMNVIPMTLSFAEAGESEPWEQVHIWQDSPAGVGVLVAHYCQRYRIGNFTWYKADNKETDIRLCNRSMMNFASPNKADTAEMQRTRNGPLSFKNGTKEAVLLSRTMWMLDHALEPVRRAINAYYDEFCMESGEINTT